MKKMLKLKMIGVLAAMLLLMLAVTVAYAQGHTYDQLENAGWFCVNTGPHNWKHCFVPNSFPPAPGPSGKLPATIQVSVFDVAGEQFLGTELLIRHDLYEKGLAQPCPQDGGEPYHDIFPDTGLPYYACHHFDTSLP